jgi:hypothetical protein
VQTACKWLKCAGRQTILRQCDGSPSGFGLGGALKMLGGTKESSTLASVLPVAQSRSMRNLKGKHAFLLKDLHDFVMHVQNLRIAKSH